MTIPIQATITRCRHGKALVVIDSRPFNGMEIRPHDLRLLAQKLDALADMAAHLPTSGKHYRPTKVEIGANAPPRPDKCLPSYEGAVSYLINHFSACLAINELATMEATSSYLFQAPLPVRQLIHNPAIELSFIESGV
ncbi:hypothetical protein ACLSSQ_11695 [Azospira sp. APE16]|uniref:hypothetical protein n=1 Tax=Azospira sp. APE16 TaxID=3394231 RepID=UPI003A4E08A1